MSDEAVTVAVAHRLRCRACEPNTCPCGKAVDARGLHGLWCRRSGLAPASSSDERHRLEAIKQAQIPATKEPVSLIQQDGKRSDGTTLLPWARGKPMAWDVTVPDTCAESHIDQTAREACSAANKAAANKIVKYGALSASHIFLPVAVETAGTWNQSAIELIQEIGRRITAVTEDTRETVFLFQCLSIAFQKGNAVAFLATLDAV